MPTFGEKSVYSLEGEEANHLKSLNESGRTIILVTHDLNIANKCKRQIHMSDGKIIKDVTEK